MSPYCLRSSSAPLQAPLGTPVTLGNPPKHPELFAHRPTPARRRSITAGPPQGDHPRAPRLRLSAPPSYNPNVQRCPPPSPPPSVVSTSPLPDLAALAQRVQDLARSVSRSFPPRSAHLPARPSPGWLPPAPRRPLLAQPLREEFPPLPSRRPAPLRQTDTYRPTYSSITSSPRPSPKAACCLCLSHKQLIERLLAIEELVRSLPPLTAEPRTRPVPSASEPRAFRGTTIYRPISGAYLGLIHPSRAPNFLPRRPLPSQDAAFRASNRRRG